MHYENEINSKINWNEVSTSLSSIRNFFLMIKNEPRQAKEKLVSATKNSFSPLFIVFLLSFEENLEWSFVKCATLVSFITRSMSIIIMWTSVTVRCEGSRKFHDRCTIGYNVGLTT